MASQKQKGNPESPMGDDTQPQPRKVPQRGRRFRLFDDGDGDYRIYAIADAETIQKTGVPAGTLFPLPEVPGFESSAAASKFVKNSGDRFEGMQLMIMRGLEIMSVQVETQPRVSIRKKPKKPVKPVDPQPAGT